MGSAIAPPVATKRLNFNLSEKAFNELQDLAKRTRRSMTELIRLSVGLLKIALEASDNGHRLVVATRDGQAIKEIVLPD